MSLYKYIFNPSDSISFLSVLRSPLTGFSDDMIFTLLEGYDSNRSLMSYLEEFSDTSPVAARAYNLFTKCLKLKGTLNSYELIKRLCDETNYGEILLSLQGGEQKYRNLEKLFSLVMDFERKNIYNPGELPMYLELMEANGGMNEEAFIDTEDSDSVKIMTIHASKGLEFDAVIIPDMDRKIDWIVRRDKPLFFYDEEKGIIWAGIKDEENPDYQEFYDRQILKENNASKRIFYVAATRAKRYLAFVGENQESPDKDEPSLNTFMIQMKWALKDRIVDTMEHTDGKSFISSPPLPAYPPDFATEAIKELKRKGYDGEIIKSYEGAPAGSISISMYQKYLTCPRLYYFQYLARLESDHRELQEEDLLIDKKTDALLRGNVVHEILSHLNSVSDRDMNEKIEKLIKEKVSKHKEDYISEDEIRKYIVNYLDIEKNLRKDRKGKYLKSFYEFRFSVPLHGNILLNGIADRVDLYENNGQIEVFIIEYKTDTVRNINDIKEKIDFYRKQLYSYMYALEKMTFREGFKTEVKKSYIYILQKGLYEEIEKHDREIEELREELIKSSRLLLGREDFNGYKCNVSGLCPMCYYKTLCDRLGCISVTDTVVGN
ncbi:MAG: ATP-dependent helicase/nuclease subunit A [bacterium ADurb.Bin363]|nr:MAG: ATP-dependent helicase/nuclease subunit A [bacterium ADurb.Bin363]